MQRVSDLRIVWGAAERIDELESLWGALHAHHASIEPAPTGLEARSRAESWARRRACYARWLDEPETFLLLAEAQAEASHGPVGYAFVRIVDGFQGFGPGERMASVETLSVLPAARGRGAGTALLDAVDEELARRGITQIRLAVVAGNDGAMRFYARRGFATVTQIVLAPVQGR